MIKPVNLKEVEQTVDHFTEMLEAIQNNKYQDSHLQGLRDCRWLFETWIAQLKKENKELEANNEGLREESDDYQNRLNRIFYEGDERVKELKKENSALRKIDAENTAYIISLKEKLSLYEWRDIKDVEAQGEEFLKGKVFDLWAHEIDIFSGKTLSMRREAFCCFYEGFWRDEEGALVGFVPQSIAWDKMEQSEFTDLTQKVSDVLNAECNMSLEDFKKEQAA